MDANLSICQTCLSKNRNLYPLSNLHDVIMEIGLWELKDKVGSICWECRRAIMKYYRFKLQVQCAQQNWFETSQHLESLSKLTQKTKCCYDFEYDFDEKKTVKDSKVDLEIKVETSDYYDDFNEESELQEDIYVDTIKKVKKENIRNNTKKIKKKNSKLTLKNKSETEELKDKFTMVILSEEEMVKNREEKRSHPNFKKIPFKCDTCVLGFTRKSTYDCHMEKKHVQSAGNYVCDVCQIRFPNTKAVDRHRRKHFVCYRCILCKYETVELWSALSHCKLKHESDSRDSIHCSQCKVVVNTPEALIDHMRSQHPLKCGECGEKFTSKSSLRTHKIRIHTDKREFICDICNRTFITKMRLESHMVNHNSVIAKKLAYCSVCNVQYKNIYVYRNHVKNSANHSERAYPCPECDKKFASKVYWTKHYNFYHLQKSQFHCELCNKLFISDWRLKNHRQKHHGLSRSRDHACNVCGKKFFTLSTLRGHELTHSEQRSYMCEDCGDTFKQRPALYTHTRLVHKGMKRRK